MKRCPKCLLEKEPTEFNKNNAKKDGLASACRSCMKSYQSAHYYSNHEVEKAKRIDRKVKIREDFNDLRSKLSCTACGQNHPAALDFHHTDPSTKERNVTTAIHQGWSMSRVLEEMQKCTVLCASCHRILHWEERQ